MATLSDVAELAGVSISAVSRVLSNAPSARVSAETRQRIHDAARELDYRPNFAARALKFSRTNVVALVVPDLTNAIFTELMRGVEEEAHANGYMVLLARAEGMPPGEESIPRLIGEGRVDGVLVQVGDNMRPEDLTTLLGGRVPAVLINSTHRGHVGSVALEDERAARIAVEHLVGLGHTRIGLLNGIPHTDTAVRRGIGFRAAMEDAGLAIDDDLVTTLGYEPRQGREALRELAALPERPTAVVVANVNAALGALLEARVLGIRVPEDLSIVAIHDAWTAETTWPPLTTVRMPLYELGRHAMKAIFERITEGKVEDVVVTDPPPELIIRGSTASPRSV
ncbi:LacI family DNA-binding transcriptional regulator [Lacisediminihabitans sp.]|jgi:LacI family transcriptional regulator|uniref:LacI family DNA-binding transcriptional regulator n=1 Tax=Lacisediminihabitans sp. TaxID=2787631 RepID=UPI002F91E1C2